jgi:hypothetical protein
MEMENAQQSSLNQPSPPVNNVPQSHPSKKPLIAAGVIIGLFIFGIGGYFIGTRNTATNKPSPSSVPQQSSSSIPTVTASPISPKMVVFMRKGEIWIKDFITNQDKKISKTAKVDSPKFSPTGQHLYYFQIVHAGGGFPRYNLFVNDARGTYEKTFTNGANHYASKLKWSNDGKYLGMVLFGNDIPGGANYSEEAYIYDTIAKNEVLMGKLSRGYKTYDNEPQDQYIVEGNCSKIESAYKSFCEEYVAYLKTPRSNDKPGYKSEEYSKSKYTKPNYQLTKSEKLVNGLVVLEYYTGEPQNPESNWGIGGGVFVPGYDEGVTQTYTVLLDETTDKVITELPLAINTDFIF